MGVYLEMIPKREREDLRRKCQSKPLAINFDACGSVLLLLDALDEAEQENDRLDEELEHYVQSTFVDAGANPAIAWKDRCLEAERQLSEERKARARDNAAMLKVGPAECG